LVLPPSSKALPYCAAQLEVFVSFFHWETEPFGRLAILNLQMLSSGGFFMPVALFYRLHHHLPHADLDVIWTKQFIV
jgi:hypothetical protein